MDREDITISTVLSAFQTKDRISVRYLESLEKFQHYSRFGREWAIIMVLEELEKRMWVKMEYQRIKHRSDTFLKSYLLTDEGKMQLELRDGNNIQNVTNSRQIIQDTVNLLKKDTQNVAAPINLLHDQHEPKPAKKTFFCYSRVDLEFVLKLAEDLSTKGYDIWMDQLELSAGDRWSREIETALHHCPNFLVILSPESILSDNVNDEINYAVEEKKKIIPVLLYECKIPYRIRSLQYVDFTKSKEAAFIRLTKKLDELVNKNNH